MYEPLYCRTWSEIKALEARGVEIIHINYTKGAMWRSDIYPTLYRGLKALNGDYDIIFAVYPSWRIYPFLWTLRTFRLIPNKPIVFDAFISIYDTKIFDRGVVSRVNPMAWLYWFLDWFPAKTADYLATETESHRKYWMRKFRISPERISPVHFGANRDLFTPRALQEKKPGDKFIVSFHGKITSEITGIDFMIDAIKMLEKENIEFRFIGKGPLLDRYQKKTEALGIKNIVFTGWINQDKLCDFISQSDAILGAYGLTPKGDRVIAAKVYEAFATKRPVLIGDNSAAREILTDRVHGVFVKMGDARDLADKILLLKNDKALRKKVAEGGLAIYETTLSPETIGKELQDVFEKTLNNFKK